MLGHWFMVEKPEATVENIREFLRWLLVDRWKVLLYSMVCYTMTVGSDSTLISFFMIVRNMWYCSALVVNTIFFVDRKAVLNDDVTIMMMIKALFTVHTPFLRFTIPSLSSSDSRSLSNNISSSRVRSSSRRSSSFNTLILHSRSSNARFR
jgi:hypothetical protein